MNYIEMSDDAIAREVVIAMGGKEMSDGVFLCENKRYDMCSPKSNFNFDPCNSWADAGPIILSCKLWLREMFGTWQARGFPGKPHSHNQVGWSDNNPLRAAMIVFLMMQEQK